MYCANSANVVFTLHKHDKVLCPTLLTFVYTILYVQVCTIIHAYMLRMYPK